MSNHSSQLVTKNFLEVKKQIEELSDQWHPGSYMPELMVVSKTQSTDAIASLYNSTQHNLFGENYVKELELKAAELKDLPISWHFIGKLQSNKISKLVELCSCIQTLESEKHARYIARYALEFKKTPYPVYIAVNAGAEAQKSGIPLERVSEFAEQLRQYTELKVLGIMSIPPSRFTDSDYNVPPDLYLQLAAVAKSAGEGKLSLGMSKDLKLAIQSGSSCVRIGRAIFGERL